ncbi:MAG: type I restriction enzyme HsdR N-terminal domain-containing protein [Desulfamplus sp.]|nr:type I restriction enzyme HsdR N-terminal domain-containing protein [Desulfamplus sp.]
MNLTLIDYITGKMVPDIGAEGSRQLFERFLVENRGYEKQDVLVDVPIKIMFKDEEYTSKIDLIVCCNEKPLMAIRCIAGSLASYEREILAAARLVYDVQIPFSVSTNGKEALVRDVISGKAILGNIVSDPYLSYSSNKEKDKKNRYENKVEGLELIPRKNEGIKFLESFKYIPFPLEKKEREMTIFRSYDLERNEQECDASPFLTGQIL